MKELSIEQKAQRYDEAIELAQKLLKTIGNATLGNLVLKNEFERMFPELKESEDEKIRKEIVFVLKNANLGENLTTQHSIEEMLAWLEKQVEQKDERYKYLNELLIADDIYQMSMNDDMIAEAKNKAINAISKMEISKLLNLKKQGGQKIADGTFVNVDDVREDFVQKVYRVLNADSTNDRANQIIDAFDNLPTVAIEKQDEQKPASKVPKFKVGDWIITNKNHIWYVDETPETTSYLYRLINQYGKVEVAEFEVVDKKARLWTIQDAKDGDVLVLNNEVFIYSHRKQMYSIAVAHCFVDSDGSFYLDGEFGYKEYGKTISPATKEQRDTLFAEMKEAGYMWNSESKQLLSLETKSSEEKKSTWTEEDEKYTNIVVAVLCSPSAESLYSFHNVKSDDIVSWFMLLKDRVLPQQIGVKRILPL